MRVITVSKQDYHLEDCQPQECTLDKVDIVLENMDKVCLVAQRERDLQNEIAGGGAARPLDRDLNVFT